MAVLQKQYLSSYYSSLIAYLDFFNLIVVLVKFYVYNLRAHNCDLIIFFC